MHSLSNLGYTAVKEDFDKVMRLAFHAASIFRHDLELGEDATGKNHAKVRKERC
jgi:hypothetical protein